VGPEDKKIYRVKIPLKIERDAVLKRMRSLGGRTRNENTARRLEQMTLELIDTALKAARPKGIYRVASSRIIDRGTVAVDGVRFSSRALSRCLEGQPTVYPLIATAGRELDELPTAPGDLMRRYTLDIIKMIVLFSASEYLTDYIKKKYALQGVAALNPGEFEDFPIGQQRPLMALFDGAAERLIGVTLTSGSALKPTKSRSGILFPNETGFLACRLCTMLKCPGRRAAYDPAAVKEYIGAP
jgi:hypothetical protein